MGVPNRKGVIHRLLQTVSREKPQARCGFPGGEFGYILILDMLSMVFSIFLETIAMFCLFFNVFD
jgi:hypothetical protein